MKNLFKTAANNYEVVIEGIPEKDFKALCSWIRTRMSKDYGSCCEIIEHAIPTCEAIWESEFPNGTEEEKAAFMRSKMNYWVRQYVPTNEYIWYEIDEDCAFVGHLREKYRKLYGFDDTLFYIVEVVK